MPLSCLHHSLVVVIVEVIIVTVSRLRPFASPLKPLLLSPFLRMLGVKDSIELGGSDASTGDDFVEGVSPAWLEQLKKCPSMEQYKGSYTKDQTLRKNQSGKVLLVNSTSASGAVPLACKCYERKDERMLERWALELAIHQTVSGHPHIVTFYSAYYSEMSLVGAARCNFIMELCRESLYDFILYWHQIDFRDVELFGMDMCMGLRHIHNLSILHRDIKPANCLLKHTAGQRVVLKICDFGNSVFLTRIEKGRFPHCKKLTPMMTTYRYCSPEVAKRAPYGFALDMWSVGVILYELLQEDARIPAVDFDQATAGVQNLEKALVEFCNKVDQRRRQGASTAMEQLALQLLEVAAEARPSAAKAVEQFASMGLRDVEFAERDAEAGKASMGLRDAKVGKAPGSGVVVDIPERPADCCPQEEGSEGHPGDRVQDDDITGGGVIGVAGASMDQRDVDEARLPFPCEHHEILAWAVKFKDFLDTPGDMPAFVEAAQKLGRHRGHVLLMSILARAKYPTVVRDLALRFAGLPIKFSAAQLKKVCHDGIRHAASINETPKLQREMIIYDDQRMGCHMGLARIMEKLGLLRASTKGTESGSKIVLGHGKPRKQYILAYDEELLKSIVAQFSQVYVAVEGVLTNESLFQAVDKLSALLSDGIGGKSVQLPTICKKPTSELHDPSLASGGTAKKKSYNTMHYLRKHMYWLVMQHEAQGTCKVNWDFKFADLLGLVPDETDQLQDIGLDVSVLPVAQCLGAHPLLVSCHLCLTHRVAKVPDKLAILSDAGNRAELLRLKQDHVASYGIPASPWQLVRDFEVAAKKTPSASGGVRKRPACAASLASPGPPPPVPLAELSGAKPSVAEPALAASGELPLASGEGERPGAPGEGVRAQQTQHEWHRIAWESSQKIKCRCKGNCLPRCPAHTKLKSGKAGVCPNPAVWNLPVRGASKQYNAPVPLCNSCVCQNPECSSGARRPYKDYALNLCNYGRCRKCWVLQAE